MKVAIVGSRKFPLLFEVERYVDELFDNGDPDLVVVSGGADGVDKAAENEARYLGIPVLIFCVSKYGLARYPDGKTEFAIRAMIRNQRIASECDRMVAFWDGKSGGTKDAINAARALGKPVEVRRA